MESLPEGRYLSAFGRVSPSSGGKTIAVLARNRLLTTTFGVPTTVLTLDPTPRFDAVRSELRARGVLVPGMELVNLFEWYRSAPPEAFAAGRDGGASGPAGLSDLGALEAVDVPHADGTVDHTVYRAADGDVVARDHRRPDGSVFVRQTSRRAEHHGVRARVVLVNHAGRPVQAWPHRRGWHRHWLRALVGDARRAFLFTDSPEVLDQLWPVADPRFRSVHVMHEIHARTAGRAPDGGLAAAPVHDWFAGLLAHLERLDALVVLTEQERADVRGRFEEGRVRLAMVPNAIEQADAPAPAPGREPATFVMMARLAPAKAVDRAVEAFTEVVRRHPTARLEVYGAGPSRDEIARLVEARGLTGRVVLCGYNPGARDRLTVATGFLSTATKETFGLSLLEAMARGCPVVAYSVPYGPREFVDDGVNGFLVADGDTAALAGRICELVEAPEAVERLSRGARATAARFAPERVAEAWRSLLVPLA